MHHSFCDLNKLDNKISLNKIWGKLVYLKVEVLNGMGDLGEGTSHIVFLYLTGSRCRCE